MSADYGQKTYQAKTGEIRQDWRVVDVKGKVLGRAAQEIAMLLMGKHKPSYTAHVDSGDFVVVLNADKVALTGKKRREKMYERFSGYPGGRKLESFESLNSRRPGEPLRLAIKRMLPKSNLGRYMLKKLKLYKGDTHPHSAQNPVTYELQGRARA